MMSSEIPNWPWYVAKSSELRLTPRCPFATTDRCPRYAESRLLLAKQQVTSKLTHEQQKRIQEIIEQWGAFAEFEEEEASISTTSGAVSGVANFCPEVSYEIYNYFVSYWHKYADEQDQDTANRMLDRQNADKGHPGRFWSGFRGMHYSECRIYSVLMGSKSES